MESPFWRSSTSKILTSVSVLPPPSACLSCTDFRMSASLTLVTLNMKCKQVRFGTERSHLPWIEFYRSDASSQSTCFLWLLQISQAPPSPLTLVFPPKPLNVSPMNSFRKAGVCREKLLVDEKLLHLWDITAWLRHVWLENSKADVVKLRIYIAQWGFFFFIGHVEWNTWESGEKPESSLTFLFKILLHSSVCSLQAGFHQPVFMQISNLHIKTPEWSLKKTQKSLDAWGRWKIWRIKQGLNANKCNGNIGNI